MKVRIISGIVGVILAIVVLLLRNTFVFPLAIAALGCLALYELYKAGEVLHCKLSIVGGFLYAVLLPFLTYYGNTAALIAISFLCLALIFLDLVVFHDQIQYTETSFLVAVSVLVPWSFNTLILLLQCSEYGLGYVILALCSAWISDTGAYFVGTFLGKHPLCPSVSPKKTVEGFFGGILVDIVVLVIIGLVYSLITGASVQYAWLIFAAIMCGAISVLGDLSASVLKRQKDMKDFGKIMPGHGGIMDRFDSVLFAVPAFYALVCMSPIFY